MCVCVCVDFEIYAGTCSCTCVCLRAVGQWWAAGCQRKRPGSADLNGEKRNMTKRRGEEKREELEERRGERGVVPHGLVSRTLPCWCAGDGFLQCSGHIITFTHFCLVSRSTEASLSWDREQKSCRRGEPRRWPAANFRRKHINKIHQQKAARNKSLLYTCDINAIFYVQ